MDVDLKEVFPDTAQAELPEIPEEATGESEESGSDDKPRPPTSPPARVNRRFMGRPRCHSTNIEGNIKKVLHNVIKTKGPLRRQHLETIFEEPIKENGKVMLISVKRAKRSINFSQFVSKAKQRVREAKAKKVLDKLNEERLNDVSNQLCKMDL